MSVACRRQSSPSARIRVPSFSPDRAFFRITPQRERVAVMRRLGLDGVIIRRFDAALAATPARAFLERFIRDEIAASGIVVGHDFHFGKGREGTPETMRGFCEAHGLGCEIVPVVEETGAAISSSAISRRTRRRRYREGPTSISAIAGFVTATIRHGEKRGRDLGYPTANMALAESCALRHGIYAVRMKVEGVIRDGVPPVSAAARHLITGPRCWRLSLFDYSGDLYDKEASVEFVAFLRGEERFDSAEALIAQMDRDGASRPRGACRRIAAVLDAGLTVASADQFMHG